ncbi:MAG TPA: polyprenyl synthetase family protein [Herpetosiphonaceae bacterium]
MNLARFIHRLATDATFAARFQEAPDQLLSTEQVALDDGARSALLTVCRDHVQSTSLCNPAQTPPPFAWAPAKGSYNHPMQALWDSTTFEDDYLRAMQAGLERDPGTAAATGARSALMELPSLCCEAAGGLRQRAQPVTTAWNLLYFALHMLDTLEDGDRPDASWFHWGIGAAINITTGLLATSSRALDRLEQTGVSASVAQAIRHDFNRTLFTMCVGQHHDLTLQEPSLEQCWQIAEAKSGAFFALPCRAGARLAGANAQTVRLFGNVGLHLGMLIQIGDDLSGLWSTDEAASDLVSGRQSMLPIVYALHTASADDCQLLRSCLQQAVGNPEAEATARQLIINSGAVLYLMTEAQRHAEQAQRLLASMSLPSAPRKALQALLDRSNPARHKSYPHQEPTRVTGPASMIRTV